MDADGPDAPISVFESGAILQYLAEKTGKFIPTDARARIACLEWLNWQMGGLGPMLGQAHHFRIYAPEQVPYGIERYTTEANRLYRVIDKRLSRFIWRVMNTTSPTWHVGAGCGPRSTRRRH